MVTNFQQPTAQDIARARRQWQLELAQEEHETTQRLVDAYTRLLKDGSPIDRTMNALVTRIATMENPDPQDVQDLREYNQFLSTVKTDMDDFSAIYRNEAGYLAESAALKGNESALAMTQANVPVASAEIAIGWNEPNPKALAELVNIVDNETWRARQASFGDKSAEQMADTILGMVAQGKHPRFIARGLRESLQIPYTWADNTVRTAQIVSYRKSSHLAYASNPQFLEGWVWQAATGSHRTCLSCVSKHGQLFPLEQELNDHHRGRCTPLPKVKGTRWHDEMQSGEDWFRSLTPAEHQAYRARIRNNKLYDGVRSGEIPFNKLSTPYEDSVYGEMLRQATYAEAIRK